MSEELIDVNIENIEITKKVNPHNDKTAWRSQGEKYDYRPINPKEYYKDYFKLHCKDRINCDRCGKSVLLLSKSKHYKTLHCRLTVLELAQ